jgi:pimeloyl-ACP methyl ester carboxylesterase
MAEELVWTRSEDGLQLEGAVFRPPDGGSPGPAVVLVHGMGSRFYSHSVALLGRELAARGLPAVSGNNRGHDYGAWLTDREGRLHLHGAGWEDLGEAPRDVAAWVDFACRQLGRDRVLLVGHSLGGFKVALYQAERRDRRVAGLALLSPVRVPGRPWLRPGSVELARQWLAAGRDRELLPEPLGWLGRASARTVASHDPHRWGGGLEALLPRAGCPVFASYGSEQDLGGGAELADLAAAGATVTRLFAGADHNYRDRWPEVADALAAFAATL